MIEIKGDSANELFKNVAIELLRNGKESSPRGLKTLEIQDAFLILNNPKESIVTLKSRKISLDYLNAEMNWYKSCDLSIVDISKASKFWLGLANPDGTVNSNYGYLAFKEKFNEKSQVDWCIEKLNKDKDTRQAIINYNQPRHKYDGNKDFVCTISQSFRVNDGLDSTTLMRSNDLIFGLTYDMPWFTYLQTHIADKTNNKLGIYKHYAASLHVYEKHFNMLECIANEEL